MRILISLFVVLQVLPLSAEDLLMYSSRKDHLIKPLVKAYKKETGVEVKYITGKAGPLLQRILAEKSKSPADIFMTVDAGNLWNAAEKGIFEPIKSSNLNSIPSAYRDKDNQWFGLSVRARTIFYNSKLVKPSELSTYEDLASAKWKGKLCLRTSKKVYNQSLVAMLIAEHGEKKTQEIVRSWVKNLQQPVFSNDTKLLEAIASGDCHVGIANTYYFGRLVKKKPSIPVKLFWANQKSQGVHVNVSGAGVLKYSKKKKQAQKFLEWLKGAKAQEILSGLNMEYPVSGNIKLPSIVEAWGTYKPDQRNLTTAGKNQAKAVMLMGKAKYK